MTGRNEKAHQRFPLNWLPALNVVCVKEGKMFSTNSDMWLVTETERLDGFYSRETFNFRDEFNPADFPQLPEIDYAGTFASTGFRLADWRGLLPYSATAKDRLYLRGVWIRNVDGRGRIEACDGTIYGRLMLPDKVELERVTVPSSILQICAGFDQSSVVKLRKGKQAKNSEWRWTLNLPGCWIHFYAPTWSVKSLDSTTEGIPAAMLKARPLCIGRSGLLRAVKGVAGDRVQLVFESDAVVVRGVEHDYNDLEILSSETVPARLGDVKAGAGPTESLYMIYGWTKTNEKFEPEKIEEELPHREFTRSRSVKFLAGIKAERLQLFWTGEQKGVLLVRPTVNENVSGRPAAQETFF